MSSESASSMRRGSSPLARGLPHDRQQRPLRLGIIPARAGFTPKSFEDPSNWPDHPRSRGVYARRTDPPRPRQGSSPLARGLPGTLSARPRRGRIIPARAGFTSAGRPGRRRSADHPRSRGVYRGHCGGVALQPGSSPLARGLREPISRRSLARRIIPARAGFTLRTSCFSRRPRDHPRSRGVYWVA